MEWIASINRVDIQDAESKEEQQAKRWEQL
jgi:hypothetical protein